MMWKFIKEFFGFFDKPEITMPKDTRREDITELYKTILGREPDKDGLDWWVNSQATLDEIKSEFLKSPEYVMKSRLEQITKLYQEVLGRDPDADGLKFWAEGPLAIDEIRVEFMKSDEYLAKITPTPEPVVEVKPEPKVETAPTTKPASKSTPKTAAKGRPKKTK